ncbi:hypothetical protein PYCCODRAFT_1438924 [Trametes coccinea BRFM310]|uniref:Uncharacterized protein n=1 Tax=Trametes coccinea (strain BRFM310) TaxID=1353009 RepID=A0A1Y2IFU1_TRAC3|nr:hypothetical protein PYCCODRAFT_1438924 [Trametes coccinea BRFM310]
MSESGGILGVPRAELRILRYRTRQRLPLTSTTSCESHSLRKSARPQALDAHLTPPDGPLKRAVRDSPSVAAKRDSVNAGIRNRLWSREVPQVAPSGCYDAATTIEQRRQRSAHRLKQ